MINNKTKLLLGIFTLISCIAIFPSLVSASSDVSVWQGQYYTGTTFNTGTYDFTFTVYDALTGGNSCYTNTTTLTTGSFGEWKTEQTGVNSACNNVSKDYYLNININGADQTPRRRLVVWNSLRKNVDEATTGALQTDTQVIAPIVQANAQVVAPVVNVSSQIIAPIVLANDVLGSLNWSYVKNAPAFLTTETDPVFTAENASIWNAILNISLTPGPKGDQGDKGDAGTNGTNGIDGVDGRNGTDGATYNQALNTTSNVTFNKVTVNNGFSAKANDGGNLVWNPATSSLSKVGGDEFWSLGEESSFAGVVDVGYMTIAGGLGVNPTFSVSNGAQAVNVATFEDNNVSVFEILDGGSFRSKAGDGGYMVWDPTGAGTLKKQGGDEFWSLGEESVFNAIIDVNYIYTKDMHAKNYFSEDGTQGWTGAISVRKGDDSGSCTLTVKDGLITGHTC
jgi:hypothetical protein